MDALKTGRTGAAVGVGAAGDLVPAGVITRELGIVRRTLARWVDDPKLDFPRPVIINGRWYFGRAQIEAWKVDRLHKSIVRGL
jgi:hypothetical protein